MPEAWEACMTLGDWWGWTKGSAYQSSGSVIRYLVRAVARNGNLLLDVGPDANGELDPQAVKVLKEIGAWLKVNGEAIYGTRPVKPYELGNVFFTGKADGTVYAIALSSQDGEPMPKSVILPCKPDRQREGITLVGGDGTVLSRNPAHKADTTEVSLPPPAPSDAQRRRLGAEDRELKAASLNTIVCEYCLCLSVGERLETDTRRHAPLTGPVRATGSSGGPVRSGWRMRSCWNPVCLDPCA